VIRSTHALGAALVALMLEEKFNNITVQSILDRAGVGRSTFYAHFRNKQDVLHSSYEQMFAWLEQKLDEPSPVGARIVPVAEFLMHIGDAGPLVDALRSSGQLQEISDLGVGFLARMIERHIRALAGTTPAVPAALVARMLAAALMEMVEWWGDHQSTMTQTQMCDIPCACSDIASPCLV
jgi:Transcriptional regulator